jgi:hypothetical protein
LNPDDDLPAYPGSFHCQSDAKRQMPHISPPSFECKADAAVGEACPPQYTAGSVRAAFASKLPNIWLKCVKATTNAGLYIRL